MLDQFNEQLKTSMKPFSELATLNMSTMQEVAEKQNALFTALLNEGVAFAEKAGQQKDVMSLAATQKAYFEILQETITESAKDTYALVNEASQKAGVMLKDMGQEVTAKFTPTK